MTRTLLPVLLGLLAAGGNATTLRRAADSGIPLVKDLVIVTAVQWPDGDYESLKRVVAVSERDVTLTVSAEAPSAGRDALAGLPGSASADGKPQSRRVNARRVVRREDLQNAHEYVQRFWEDAPSTFPGSTALGVSAAVLNELKGKGTTRITVVDQRSGSAAGAIDRPTISGTLRTVKGGSGTLTLLVNGTPTPLPIVHANGELEGVTSELFILDDPANPLALKYSFGDVHLQVVRLEFPQRAADVAGASTIEERLASVGKVDVYGIYFDFGSDRIKPESEPVLAEIARALNDNPMWKLSIDGHTDNIGGETFNLDLSRRRAASVRQALITSYKVAATRLTTSGHGATRPKDTNGTLAGRARNRRVELVR